MPEYIDREKNQTGSMLRLHKTRLSCMPKQGFAPGSEVSAQTAVRRWMEERKRMTKQEALTKARKDVARTELDICHAEKRNARTEEMEALRRKLEYRKYIMEAVKKLDATETFS